MNTTQIHTADLVAHRTRLAREIASILRKRTALDEALRRRQIALARLDASPVPADEPRTGPTQHEQ